MQRRFRPHQEALPRADYNFLGNCTTTTTPEIREGPSPDDDHRYDSDCDLPPLLPINSFALHLLHRQVVQWDLHC